MPQFRLFFFLALDYRHEFGCRLHRGKQSQDSVVQITMMAVSTAYRHYGDLLVEFSPSRRESVSYRLEAWRGYVCPCSRKTNLLYNFIQFDRSAFLTYSIEKIKLQ